MRNKKNTPSNPPWDQGTYQTGRTTPPKRHQGVVAVLLVVVILLCGIISALSLMNIHLFRQLAMQKRDHTLAISLSDRTSQLNNLPYATAQESDALSPQTAALGLEGEWVSSFYQKYYRLPAGLYVTRVEPGGSADLAGIQPGDILVSMDSTPINSLEALQAILSRHQPGDKLAFLYYRDRWLYPATLALQQSVENSD